MSSQPIGVFDSGVGGLTVLRTLRRHLPCENYIYLGDTARLPYGTKSGATIARYSLEAAAALLEQGIKMLVVACNSATAAALPSLHAAYPQVPVIGVIEPGARAACAVSGSGRIAVIGTAGTIRSGAHKAIIEKERPGARITGVPCSLFVSLAEEGWMDGPIVTSIAEHYLAQTFAPENGPSPDCLVLGCTHFPPLAPAIQRVVGHNVQLVDPAQATAAHVARILGQLKLTSPGPVQGSLRLLATDDPERFARVGSIFLDRQLLPEQIEIIDLTTPG